MKCKICCKKTSHIFDGTILDKYRIKYFQCDFCGFLQTEEPYWLNESYASVITKSDIGLISRNLNFAEVTKVLIFSLYSNKSHRDLGLLSHKIFRKLLNGLKLKKNYIKQKFTKIYASDFDFNAKYIDYGGGYGIFVRLMRDMGLDFYWHDTHCQNIFAQQFEANLDINYNLLTACEIFEHLPDPIHDLDKMLKLSDSILFSTVLLPTKKIPAPDEWWYYGLEHGQHISFYTKKTLGYIAAKYNLNFYSNSNDIHFLTKKRIDPYYMMLIFKKPKMLSKLIDDTIMPKSLLQSDFNKITGKHLK
jgi:hypothetical protein